MTKPQAKNTQSRLRLMILAAVLTFFSAHKTGVYVESPGSSRSPAGIRLDAPTQSSPASSHPSHLGQMGMKPGRIENQRRNRD